MLAVDPIDGSCQKLLHRFISANGTLKWFHRIHHSPIDHLSRIRRLPLTCVKSIEMGRNFLSFFLWCFSLVFFSNLFFGAAQQWMSRRRKVSPEIRQSQKNGKELSYCIMYQRDGLRASLILFETLFFFDWMSKTWKDFDYLQDVKADVERCWSAEETIVEESLENHRASFNFKVNFYQRVSNQVANKSWISVRVRHFFLTGCWRLERILIICKT